MAVFYGITCCCSNGLGSSLLVGMNIRSVLSELGRSDIPVNHVPLSEANPMSRDLFVVGLDIAPQMGRFSSVIVLKDLISKDELREKLQRAFDSETRKFRIE